MLAVAHYNPDRMTGKNRMMGRLSPGPQPHRLTLTLAVGLWLAGIAAAHAEYSAGRLAAAAGSVLVRTSGEPAAHEGNVNELVAEGDQLFTVGNGSAQFEFPGVVLALGPASQVTLTRVASEGLTVHVDRGEVAVARLGDRPPDALVLEGPGSRNEIDVGSRVRLSVWPERLQSWLSVRAGDVVANSGQGRWVLYPGQGLQIYDGASGSVTTVAAGEGLDQLDFALIDRYGRMADSVLGLSVGGNWIGATDIDQQGEWVDSGSDGILWVPLQLPVGWAPFRQGHWQWNAVWGWAWVDALPWAWLPYHCGQWTRWNGRWAWAVPGGGTGGCSGASPVPAGIQAQPLPSPAWLIGRRPVVPVGTRMAFTSGVNPGIANAAPAAFPAGGFRRSNPSPPLTAQSQASAQQRGVPTAPGGDRPNPARPVIERPLNEHPMSERPANEHANPQAQGGHPPVNGASRRPSGSPEAPPSASGGASETRGKRS